MRRATGWVLFAAVLACGAASSGTISLITGGETDTFTQTPVPTTLRIDAVDQDGGVTNLAQSPLPATGNITLPDQNTGTTAIVRATGLDGTGNTVVWGESLPVQFGALDGLTLPIFVQRTGEFARMPTPFAVAPTAPLVGMIAGEFVLAVGGPTPANAAETELYDLIQWAPLDAPPTLPVVPQSLATVGTQALLINGGAATWYDFSDSSTSTATLPSGGSFADVAGGATVTTPTGSSFVVGGTRTAGAASAVVLAIDSQGNLSLATLMTPRKGAAAAWVAGTLVVLGGSPTGAGGEALAAGVMNAIPLPFPPDATTGAGATALDGTHVLLAGGITPTGADAGARVFDLSCVPDGGSGSCSPSPWNAPIVPLPSAQAFTLDSNTALVVGNDAIGATHAFRMTATGATEIAFKVARKGATALRLPTGPVAVIGGDVTMESFAP